VTFQLSSPSVGRTFASGSISAIQGKPGLGFFRLIVTVNLVVQPHGTTAAQDDVARLTALTAEVRTGGKPMGRFLVPMETLPVQSHPASAVQTSLQLEGDLDRARIEAIEAVRAGGNLILDVDMVAQFSNGQAMPVSEGLTVNQGVWVSILGEMEYQRALLIEVPVPDPAEQPELAAAVEGLAQAQVLFLGGHDREAVGTCRDVLEEITRAFGDDDKIDPEIERILFSNSRAMTKADRLRVLRRALKLVTHPARHRDQVAALIDWSRIDASAVITMTAAFITEMGADGARPASLIPAEPSEQAGGPDAEGS